MRGGREEAGVRIIDEPIGCGVEERGWGLMRGRGLPFLCAELSASIYGEGEGEGLRGGGANRVRGGGEGAGLEEGKGKWQGDEPIGCGVEQRRWGLSGGKNRENG